MEVKYVEGDLFAALEGVDPATTVYLPHVCNCMGGWGAGFVLPLSKHFPLAKESYLRWFKQRPKEFEAFALGHTQFVMVHEKPLIVVANMLAQTLGGPRPIYYNHLAGCMEQVAERVVDRMQTDKEVEIMCPMFGAGLAQGNWLFIEELITDTWIRRDIPVTVFYLAGTLPANWSPPEK